MPAALVTEAGASLSRPADLAPGPGQIAQAGLGEGSFVLGDRAVHSSLECDGGVLGSPSGLPVVGGSAVGGRGGGDVEEAVIAESTYVEVMAGARPSPTGQRVASTGVVGH